jgi:catechol 2,3-dioxygenase-like lactoylglutathione lyase family enzyme
MQSMTRIQHVALECTNQEQADVFFLKVLGIPKVKSTMLSQELCASIFQIEQPVQMETYDNGTARFEVFLTQRPRTRSFAHIGVEIESKADFLIRCRDHGLNPFFVEKQGKQLLFVRDFSDNLFEVIEK